MTWGDNRTSTTQHRRWAQAVRQRDGYQCQHCGHQGNPQARDIEADHIVPAYRGGTTTLDNGQALCRPCHKTKSERERLDAIRERHQRGKRPPETHPSQHKRTATQGG